MLRIKIQDLIFDHFAPNSTPVYIYDDSYFTGIAIEHYDNGQIKSERQHIEGYMDGIQKVYYPNGELHHLYKLYKSRKHGKYTEWFHGGKLKLLAMYELDHRLWIKEYDEDGNMVREDKISDSLDIKSLENDRQMFRQFSDHYVFDEHAELEAIYDFPGEDNDSVDHRTSNEKDDSDDDDNEDWGMRQGYLSQI